MIPDNTPILVGVGQVCEQLDSADYRGLSPTELAAEASRRACEDAGAAEGDLVTLIDAMAAVRTVADSVSPIARKALVPFGSTNNFPRSVAQKLGMAPSLAVYSPACGDEPQKLIGEFADRIHQGEFQMVLLCGAEAASTQRHAQIKKETLDWSEAVEGQLEDRAADAGVLRTRHMALHKMLAPLSIYPLFEHARRARLGNGRDAYVRAMGELFEPFTRVAAENPYSASPKALSAEALITPTDGNRMVADPYTKSLVARDAVNQGAAVVLTSAGMARKLGIDESRWVYLHGYADVQERAVLEREDLGASPAMTLAYRAALHNAGKRIDDIRYMDIYSCFPIAVFCATDSLDLKADDPRGLTLTGGLPFFGGPGNNYSMHAIATLVEKLRSDPGAFGMIGANGGLLSKHSVGIYSTTPTVWRRCDSSLLQAEIDGLPAPAFTYTPHGFGIIESYTVVHGKQGPADGIVVGRLEGSGERFVACTAEGDGETLQWMVDQDPIGQRIFVKAQGFGNRFAASRERLLELYPPKPLVLQEAYEFVEVVRRGRVLEVTINRPEAHNALHPYSHEELDHVFNCFYADPELWVAVITGAGDKAFCTGNDLKFSASGKPNWVPLSGFGGLTSRANRNKPIIAAVNGFAMGGGFEIALASDLVVADESAKFALSEVKVGLIAGAGGLQRLMRQIPKKVALEMILTGRRVPAEEGRELGFVNYVAPAGRAMERARQLADEIIDGSPTSVRLSMALINAQDAVPAEIDAVRAPYEAIEHLLASEDMLEGIAAFAQKRKPVWKNR